MTCDGRSGAMRAKIPLAPGGLKVPYLHGRKFPLVKPQVKCAIIQWENASVRRGH